mgnify:CR=1 FL=1
MVSDPFTVHDCCLVTDGACAFVMVRADRAKDLPKKMRRLAIRSLLSAKAADGSLRVVKDLGVSAPSTKAMSSVLKALGFERSVLVVTAAADETVKASVSNLAKVNQLPAPYLNVGDLLSAQGLLMTVDAVRGAEALWGGARAAKKRAVKAEA